MTEIDFGKLVSRVLARMDTAESERTGEENTNPYAAMQMYKAVVTEEIRQVFEEAETRADVPSPATCSYCGTVLEEEARFCAACGMPLTEEAAAERLGDLLAKDAGIARDSPRLQAALARVREEEPEAWNALLQKIAPRATA